MRLAALDWRLVRDERRPGPEQLAYDEMAAETAADGGPCTVRLYGWAAPGTLTLGYAQDAGVVDWAHCEDAGVDVTRRRTGGGAIYHDAAGDLAYAVAAPADALPEGTAASYRLLLEPVLDALAALDVDARLASERVAGRFRPACYLRPVHAAHDVVVPTDGGGVDDADSDGSDPVRKLAGSAQYRTSDAVLQHGSLSVARTPGRHAAVFADGPSPAAFRERVGSLADRGVDRDALADALADAFGSRVGAEPGDWTAAERDRARELAAEYRTDAWVRDAERADVGAGVGTGGRPAGTADGG
ncbi:MAG: biotin/lipoate A/B protein ligase family protein [Halobacteriaceae archaeon]